MGCLFLTPFTKFIEFDFPLDGLLVLHRPVVRALALDAVEFYQGVLGHN